MARVSSFANLKDFDSKLTASLCRIGARGSTSKRPPLNGRFSGASWLLFEIAGPVVFGYFPLTGKVPRAFSFLGALVWLGKGPPE